MLSRVVTRTAPGPVAGRIQPVPALSVPGPSSRAGSSALSTTSSHGVSRRASRDQRRSAVSPRSSSSCVAPAWRATARRAASRAGPLRASTHHTRQPAALRRAATSRAMAVLPQPPMPHSASSRPSAPGSAASSASRRSRVSSRPRSGRPGSRSPRGGATVTATGAGAAGSDIRRVMSARPAWTTWPCTVPPVSRLSARSPAPTAPTACSCSPPTHNSQPRQARSSAYILAHR